jgi:hypothetical protein
MFDAQKKTVSIIKNKYSVASDAYRHFKVFEETIARCLGESERRIPELTSSRYRYHEYIKFAREYRSRLRSSGPVYLNPHLAESLSGALSALITMNTMADNLPRVSKVHSGESALLPGRASV